VVGTEKLFKKLDAESGASAGTAVSGQN